MTEFGVSPKCVHPDVKRSKLTRSWTLVCQQNSAHTGFVFLIQRSTERGGGWKIGARWPPGCPQMSDNLGFRAWSGKFWSLQWKHRWDLKALWTQRQKGPRANMHIHRHIVCFRETWMRKTGGYKSPKPDWTGRPLCEVHCNVSRAISWTLEL